MDYIEDIAPSPYKEDSRIVKKNFTTVMSNRFYYPLNHLKKKGLIILHPQEGSFYIAESMGDRRNYEIKNYTY